MIAKLSASTVKRLVPQSKAFEISDTYIKGFVLRVQPTGRMTCYFSYRTIAGKRTRYKIGTLGPVLTITQARDRAIVLAGKEHERNGRQTSHSRSNDRGVS